MAGPLPQAFLAHFHNLQQIINGLPQPLQQAVGPQIVHAVNQLAQFVLANNHANQLHIQQLNGAIQNLTHQLQNAQQAYNAQVAANGVFAAANAGLAQHNQVLVNENAQRVMQINQQAITLANLTIQLNAQAAQIVELQRQKQNLERATEIREIFRKKIDLLNWGEHEAYKAKCLLLGLLLTAGDSVNAWMIQKEWQARRAVVIKARDSFNTNYSKNGLAEEAFNSAKRQCKLTEKEFACNWYYDRGIERLIA